MLDGVIFNWEQNIYSGKCSDPQFYHEQKYILLMKDYEKYSNPINP